MMTNLEREDWRLIPNSDLLEASNYGRIKDRFGNIVEPDYEDEYGVPILIGGHGAVLSHVPVWYLIFRAFVNHSNEDFGVVFLDGNPKNAAIDNLAFTTQRDEKSRIHYPILSVGKDGKLVRTLDKRSAGRVLVVETGEIFSSANEAAKAINGQQPNVFAVLNGERTHHKGYTFEYVDRP